MQNGNAYICYCMKNKNSLTELITTLLLLIQLIQFRLVKRINFNIEYVYYLADVSYSLSGCKSGRIVLRSFTSTSCQVSRSKDFMFPNISSWLTLK